jgi:hypothetical protein
MKPAISLQHLTFILLTLVLLPCFYMALKPYFFLEGFRSYSFFKDEKKYNLIQNNKYPQQTYEVLVQDSFPISHKYGVTTDQGSSIWRNYPIWKVGSYKQVTNNLRYVKNPDTGRCMAAEMCGTFYKSKRHPSNEVHPLPPVCIGAAGARVNYYNTEQNLLPYSSDTVNILY